MLPPEVGRAILAHSGAFFNLKDIVSNVLSFHTTTDGNIFYFQWCLLYITVFLIYLERLYTVKSKLLIFEKHF